MSPSLADTPALVHHFTRGIRFGTEVQCLRGGGKGQRWRGLPLTCPDVPGTSVSANPTECGALCLAQCLTALGYPGMALVKQLAPPDLGDIASLDRWLQSQDMDLRKQVLSSSKAGAIGTHALESIQSGAVCAVCISSPKWRRWVWVAGVEAMDISITRPRPQARTLLVLDGMGSPPWACGHNARIELGARGKSLRSNGASEMDSPASQLIYRHLGGQAARVSLICLVTLWR